jgi:DNA-binding winged helix-turn-helix (wHTH) protein
MQGRDQDSGDVDHMSNTRFGPFLVDRAERALRRDGQLVPLTPKAFDVLAALAEEPGKLVSKDELLRKVWPDTFVEESNLAYHIFAVRKALGDTAATPRYIETVPKRGYRFAALGASTVAGGIGTGPSAEAASVRPAESTSLVESAGTVPSSRRWALVALRRCSAPCGMSRCRRGGRRQIPRRCVRCR